MEKYFKEKFGKIKVVCPLACWEFMPKSHFNSHKDEASISENTKKIRDAARKKSK
jgi:hypothetical protein